MKHEKAKPNIAGLTSQVQQAEMSLLVAGKWPPLKPLPVFKYGTDEYRAEIYFDSARGEWVCRITSLPSNKVQEMRGGLTEMTMALPHGQADVFTEGVATEQQERESENEARRRLQAMLEWRENYVNGALYSELQDYLSVSQQDEMLDSIRMTLTARQLQFNPKNIACIFDGLCNAGGRLATLIEIAKRNKAKQEADAQPQMEGGAPKAEGRVTTPVHELNPKQDPPPVPAPTPNNSGLTMSCSAAEISIGDVSQIQEATLTPEGARNFVPEPIEGLSPDSVESVLPTTLETFPTEPIGSSSPVQDLTSPSESIARAETRASELVARTNLAARPLSLAAGLREKMQYHAAGTGFGPQLRKDKVESSADRIDDPPSQLYASETSAKWRFGFRLGALVFLAIGFTVGFTVGLHTPAVPPEAEESRPKSQSAQSPNARPADSAIGTRPTEPSSSLASRSDPSSYVDGSSSANKLDGATPSEEKPKESTQDSVSLAKAPSTDSNSSPTTESRPSANPEASHELNSPTELIARNTPPLPRRERARSLKAVDEVRGAPGHPALRRVKLGTPRPSPSSAILVTPPAEGSKSLRLTFPEKPIAASSSFAITSQLSVLVSPEPGPAVAHKPERVQAGELVSYVWPRYPGPGDRHGSSETVKVRATIGRHGEVLDVKRVSGSISLLPDAMNAIRHWRYKPTLLNKRPVTAQLDITIEFRPPQYFSRVSTLDPPHN